MLEVCVDSLHAAKIAVQAGAGRIELSEQLHLGGVTPSRELVRQVRDAIDVPLVVLVRSRPGNFYFEPHDRETMIAQSIDAIEDGAHGIAIGGLDQQNDLDDRFLRSLLALKLPCEWIMHRAFDSVRDPKSAIEQLIEIGFHRILTSGGPPTAIDGVDTLAQWVSWSQGRIEILPAGGINCDNAWDILARTGCGQLHGSFRSLDPLAKSSNLPDSTVIQKTLAVFNQLA
jgi:copper homeostasis protein